jgi:hypothetical protein
MRYVIPHMKLKARAVILLATLMGWVGPACTPSRDGRTTDAGVSSDASTRSDAPSNADRRDDANMAGDRGSDAGPTLDAAPSPPKDCKATAPTACTKPAPRYADVEPIFAQRCTICHDVSNPDGHWPLTSYQHVADWNIEIRDQVLKCTMPPPVAAVPITLEERERILLWLRCGFPK